MRTANLGAIVRSPSRLFIDGQWVAPASDAMIDVIDAATEEPFLRVAAAGPADMERAIVAARSAFDRGPWPRLSHIERAGVLRALGAAVARRSEDLAQIWPRQSGVLYSMAQSAGPGAQATLNGYADLASTFEFESPANPSNGGGFGLLVREPVGVVGAIIPWNGPMMLIAHKVGPALLAGCTVVLKLSPEAPGEGYVVAEAAEEIGLPPGVLNVVTADRDISELLVTDPRVDKISFTGSTAAGRRIASLCGERIARCTLELGGKSAAIVLDDADLATAAAKLAAAECRVSGQVCASLTRIIVSAQRHDEMVEALAHEFRKVNVGNPFDPDVGIGPLATSRQRDRVEGYIAAGLGAGATLAAGGGRPGHLDRGWFIEPTVFGHVESSMRIAQEEIFGPVLTVIPADDEADAVRIANDTIFGLNAAVFTNDVDHARDIAGRLRSGTVGHNGHRTDFDIGFGGFKQSGLGREGGQQGLLAYLESKTILLDGPPSRWAD